jgi:curved DNA-binding protein CbpA/ribosomal protein L24
MKLHSINILSVLLATSSTHAFLASTPPIIQNGMEVASSNPSLMLPMQMPKLKTQTKIRLSSTKLQYTSSLPDSSDPCILLNIEPGSFDLKKIKTAYRRMALKYHPDTRTSTNATDREKQAASDDFARINAAYAFLSGKSTDKPETTESERRQKKQRQQKANSTSPYGSSHGSRNASHRQRSASHHQREGVRTGQGFDMSGNYRTSPIGTTSARATAAKPSAYSSSARYSQPSKKGFYSRVRTPVNVGRATGTTSARKNTGAGTPSGGSASPRSSTSETYSPRVHVQIPVNRVTSAFSKGDTVEITGGSYSGQRGKVTRIYPTMVKVSILSNLDVLVESKYVGMSSISNVDPYIAARMAKEASLENQQSRINTRYRGNNASSRTYSSSTESTQNSSVRSNTSSVTGANTEKNERSKANKNWVDDIRGTSANGKSNYSESTRDSTIASRYSSDVKNGSRNTNKNWVDNTRGSSANEKSIKTRTSQHSNGVCSTSPTDTTGVKSEEKPRHTNNKNWVEDIRGSSVKGKTDHSVSSRDSDVTCSSASGTKNGSRNANKNWVDDIRGFVMKNNSVQPRTSKDSNGVRGTSFADTTAIKTKEKKSSVHSPSAAAVKTDEKKASIHQPSKTPVKTHEKNSSIHLPSATAVKTDEKKSSDHTSSVATVKTDEKKIISSHSITDVNTQETKPRNCPPSPTDAKIDEMKSNVHSHSATDMKINQKKSAAVKTEEKKLDNNMNSRAPSSSANTMKVNKSISCNTDEIWIGDIQGFVVKRKPVQSRTSQAADDGSTTSLSGTSQVSDYISNPFLASTGVKAEEKTSHKTSDSWVSEIRRFFKPNEKSDSYGSTSCDEIPDAIKSKFVTAKRQQSPHVVDVAAKERTNSPNGQQLSSSDSVVKLHDKVLYGLDEILAGKRGSRGKYKKEFRSLLEECGINRGSALVLTSDGEEKFGKTTTALVGVPSEFVTTRSLSRCTAEQLGLYIVYLLHQVNLKRSNK